MRGRINAVKMVSYILAVMMITGIPTGGAYAATKGEKSVGDIGADVTWYDLGSRYTDYYIQGDAETGFYVLSMSDGSISKTALVNAKGEIVVEPDALNSLSSSYENGENISVIQKGNDFIYIDSSGVKTIDGKDFSEIGAFRNGYAAVTLRSSSKKAVIDKNGSIIFEDKEGKYKDFKYLGGIFSAELREDQYDFLDHTGALITKSPYTNVWLRDVSEGTLSVERDGKYGFIDLSGNEIIPPVYDDSHNFSEGLAAVCKDGKWGFVDKTGKEFISPRFDYVRSFEGGLAAVSAGEKWGLIDKAGNSVLPVEYDFIDRYENGIFAAEKENRTFLLDASGKLLSAKEYSHLSFDPSGQIYVTKIVNGSTVSAFLDKNQKMMTGWKEFSLYYLSDQLYSGVKHGEYPPGVVPPHDYSQKFALLDSEGNNLTGFRYSNAGDFFNNFEVVNRYYYGTAGLINQNGAEVLPTVFDDILLTKEGYAFITISDQDTGGNSRVGFFKIPESFSGLKNIRPITVYLNGTELFLDPEPMIRNQRVMVPVRKIFESLGSKVEWNGAAKTVTGSGGNKNISLTIGSDIAYVNGSKIQLETAPFIQEGTTFVPLRFVSENLGADVQWDGNLRRVTLTSDK